MSLLPVTCICEQTKCDIFVFIFNGVDLYLAKHKIKVVVSGKEMFFSTVKPLANINHGYV